MGLKEYEKEYYAQAFQDEEDNEQRIKRVLEVIGSGRKVLDIGCWDGTIGQRIEAQGNQVTGIDLSPGAVAQAKKRINAMEGDVEAGLPFPDASFDLVFMGDIIEHIFDTRKVFKEVHRLLKPGGRFLITTINICSLRDRVLLLAGRLPAYYGIHEDHIRMFNKKKFTRLLEEQFEVKSFDGWCIEIPITPNGKKLTFNGFTKKFASLANHFVVECAKKPEGGQA